MKRIGKADKHNNAHLVGKDALVKQAVALEKELCNKGNGEQNENRQFNPKGKRTSRSTGN